MQAKTIDLCNNPLHKEGKLDMAKRYEKRVLQYYLFCRYFHIICGFCVTLFPFLIYVTQLSLIGSQEKFLGIVSYPFACFFPLICLLFPFFLSFFISFLLVFSFFVVLQFRPLSTHQKTNQDLK